MAAPLDNSSIPDSGSGDLPPLPAGAIPVADQEPTLPPLPKGASFIEPQAATPGLPPLPSGAKFLDEPPTPAQWTRDKPFVPTQGLSQEDYAAQIGALAPGSFVQTPNGLMRTKEAPAVETKETKTGQTAPPPIDYTAAGLQPALRDTGLLGAPIAGLFQAGRSVMQTGQAVTGGKPDVQEPDLLAAQPIEGSDLWKPLTLLKKTLYQFAAAAPTAAAAYGGGLAGIALGGGPEDPISWATGIAGTAAGAAAGNTIQSLGVNFGQALQETKGDNEAAWSLALKRTGIESGAAGVSYGLFGFAPFKNVLKDAVFQAFGLQPAVAVGQKAVENVAEGKPIGQDVLSGVPGAVVGTAAPAIVHAGIAHALRSTPGPPPPGNIPGSDRAHGPPETAPTEKPDVALDPATGLWGLRGPDGIVTDARHPTPEAAAASVNPPPPAPPPPAIAAESQPAPSVRGGLGTPKIGEMIPMPVGNDVIPMQVQGFTPAHDVILGDPSGNQYSINAYAVSRYRGSPESGPPSGPAPLVPIPIPKPQSPALDALKGEATSAAAAARGQPAAPVEARLTAAKAQLEAQAQPQPPVTPQDIIQQAEATKTTHPGQIVPTPEAAGQYAEDLNQIAARRQAQPVEPQPAQAAAPDQPIVASPVDLKINQPPAIQEAPDKSAPLPVGGAAPSPSPPGPEGELPLTRGTRTPEEIAQQIDQARATTETNPTPGQIDSGNYSKGRVSFHGIPFVMENPEGSVRHGVGADGQPWTAQLPSDYGYISKTEAADGEHVDAYMGPNHDSQRAFVIDQIDPASGAYDEAKVMLGFNDWQGAHQAYVGAFSDGKGEQRIGNVTPMSLDELKTWLKEGDTTKPVAAETATTPPSSRENAPRRPMNIVEFLASRGGLNPSGELRAMDAHKKFIPGYGMLVRKDGRGMNDDHAREIAQEAGYLPRDNPNRPSDSTISDLYSAIDDTLRGNARYSADDVGALRDWEDHKRAYEGNPYHNELEARASALGIDPASHPHNDDLLAMIHEREAIIADGAHSDTVRAQIERDIDAVAAAEDIPWIGDDERSSATPEPQSRAPETTPRFAESAAQSAAQTRREESGAIATRGDQVRGEGIGREPATESTAAGEQVVLPGAEQSARQAASSREAEGRGRIRSRVQQKDADEGLFKPIDNTAELPFGEPPTRRGLAEASPIFYSALERGIENAKLDKASPESWKGMIRNMPGIKKEEVDWTGVNDFLDSKKGAVTKADLLQAVRENNVQVQEVMHGPVRDETVPDARAQQEHAAAFEDLNRRIHDVDTEERSAHYANDTQRASDLRHEGGRLSAEREALHGRMVDETMARQGLSGAPAKYGHYRLPGGENYRELLLTMPQREPKIDTTGWTVRDKGPDGAEVLDAKGEVVAITHDSVSDDEAVIANTAQMLARNRRGAERQDYRSGHWQEPNVLAHVRFDDRTGPNGERVLHVAEIQSDLHQAGRKRGYRGQHKGRSVSEIDDDMDGVLMELERRDAPQLLAEKVGVNKTHGYELGEWVVTDARTGHRYEVDAANEDEAKIRAEAKYLHSDAALMASWQRHPDLLARNQELQRERNAAYAAEAGDLVPDAPFKTSWPELAVKRLLRYAAENGYQKLSWDTGATNADRYDLSKQIDEIRYAKQDDGRYTISARKRGSPRSGDFEEVLGRRDLTPQQLEDIVGKDAAKKIVDNVGRDHGEPEGAGTLRGDDLKVGSAGMVAFYDRQLPQIVNSLSKKWGAKAEDSEINAQQRPYKVTQDSEGTWIAYMPGDQYDYREFNTERGARDFASGPANKLVHSVEITPKMRESVMRGQALFEGNDKEAPVGAAITDLRDDFAQTGDPHTAARNWTIYHGQNSGHEHLAAIDQDRGELTHAYTMASPKYVAFTPDLVGRLEDQSSTMVVHHNHPLGNSLSEQDMRQLAFPGLRTIVAHGHDGNTYVAQLTPEAKEWLGSQGDAERAIGGLYATAENAVFRGLDRLVNSAEITQEHADSIYSDLINRALDSGGVIDYMSSRDLADVPGARDIIREAADRVQRAAQTFFDAKPREDANARSDRSADTIRPDESMARLSEGIRQPAAGRSGREAGTIESRAGTGEAQGAVAGLAEDRPDFAAERNTSPEQRLTPEEALHRDAVSGLIDSVSGSPGAPSGKGPTTEERALPELARRGTRQIKNLNPVERFSIFPRTLATLDDMSARFWNAWRARDDEAARNGNNLRKIVADSLVSLDSPSRNRVYAALELARKWNWRPPDDGAPIRVHNTSFWQARMSKPGDDYLLSPQETKAFHDSLRLGDEGWRTIMSAMAKREGWNGDLTAAAVSAGAREAGIGTPEGHRLARLATALHEAQRALDRPYFPAMRFGDYYVAVRPKQGQDPESLGGYPEVKWFETVEKSSMEDWLGTTRRNADDIAAVKNRIAALGTMPDNTGAPAFGAFQRVGPGRWESPTHIIETGDLRRKPDILREIDMPALEKLFALMERDATGKMISQIMQEKTPPEGLTRTQTKQAKGEAAQYDKSGRLVGGEALDRYRATTGAAKEALLDSIYEALTAGFKRRADLTPGYSQDFDRAIGTHIWQVSHNAANMVHHNAVEEAYDNIQDNHPHQSVRDYWQKWRGAQEDQKGILSRASTHAAQIGFSYALAMNPSSTLVIALHTPMAAAPVLSTGIGMVRAGAALAGALREAYGHAGADRKNGFFINLDRMGRTPDEKALISSLANEGRLRALGADDLRALSERQASTFGDAAGRFRRAMDIATSNIGIVDQANRAAVALSSYRLASNPKTLAAMAKPLAEHSALFRDMVERDGLTPENFSRFMLSEGAYEWGSENRSPVMRGPMGTLLFSLHGFQTRYLSTAFRLMKNMGPEGKTAFAWMMGTLMLGAGAYGLPFTQDAESAADALGRMLNGGSDPMTDAHLREMMSDAGFSKAGADVMLRGPIASLAGVNLSSRIGFGDVISREMDPTNVIGTIPSMLYQRLQAAYTRDQTQGAGAAAAELLPSALRNPARALLESDQGRISQKGTMLDRPADMPGADIAKQALGFQPLQQEQEYAQSDYAYRLEHQNDELRQRVERDAALLITRAARARIAGDANEAAELTDQAKRLVIANPGLAKKPSDIIEAIRKSVEQMSDPRAYEMKKTQKAQGITQNPYP
jgi:hypothetical protein